MTRRPGQGRGRNAGVSRNWRPSWRGYSQGLEITHGQGRKIRDKEMLFQGRVRVTAVRLTLA
jgi:hypothetical protein